MMEGDLTLDYNPQYDIEGVWFRSYTNEEVKALSVKEVTNPEVFDGLQQPTFGGLYDPAFGPSDRFDGCRTCGQGKSHCPGHMGHIELPLPVFNPVFFRALYRILKSTCFFCHRLIVDGGMANLFVHQCKLLDNGQIAAVGQLEELYGQLMQEKDSKEKTLCDEAIAEATNAFLQEGVDTGQIPVKNIEAVRHALVGSFVKIHLKRPVLCVHCKVRLPTLREEHKAKLILLGKATSVAEAKRLSKKSGHKLVDDDNQDDDNSEEEEDDSKATPGKRKRSVVKDTAQKAGRGDVTLLTALMVRDHLYKVWEQDGAILKRLYPTLASNNCQQPVDIFFQEIIPVPPSKFRPIAQLGDKRFENPQTANLAKVLRNCSTIREILWEIEKSSATTKLPSDHVKSKSLSAVSGVTLVEKLNNIMIMLQTSVNCLVDSDLDKLSKDVKPGIKQLLEKKEGLLRKNMMGKRVNFAARSVISPDPNINTYEIGIPMVFAKALTYPQPVTPWNVHELRQAVMNGPRKYPGAFQVVNEDGSVMLLDQKNDTQREAVAKQLLTPTTVHGKQLMGSKKVLRHLKTGDVLLINRQPTLHKPSIQAHKARVLPGEKTLRLHYANCKAYNADFDGDEMNAHFPQNEIGRAEAYNIVSTDNQYLVPKDGTPLAGLIQDHMVSGVSLTIRGQMFNKSDYCRLVYTALVDKGGPVKLLPPSILKPQRLWSGKQVLSTVVLNVLPKGKPALSLTGSAKVPEKSWVKVGKGSFSGDSLSHMGESDVIIRHGELLCGVLDKGHYGPTPYGLIHSCYELYGGNVAGKILTCFGRLFLNFLQWRGFTLGVEDILVKERADRKRHKIIKSSTKAGERAARKALGLDAHSDSSTLLTALKAAHFSQDDSRMRELDMAMRNETNQIQNDIVNSCMPKGLEKLFPDNNLQLMVVSGAKGSSVNCMQISCLLGQIELEGKRPPLMTSGRSLPSFLAYDVTPRAGGFVTGRFLTGIRQQEYFFHCMAGREGLVDTAVKTSRSGYLQRCLIKHLEGVKVNYDLTVRDGDSSVVQFYYGEDSFDICKTGFINPKQFPFLVENYQILQQEQQPTLNKSKAVNKLDKKIREWYKKHGKSDDRKVRRSGFLSFCQEVGDQIEVSGSQHEEEEGEKSLRGRTSRDKTLCNMWTQVDKKQRQRYSKASHQCPDPVISRYSMYTDNALPERVSTLIRQYAKTSLRSDSTSLSDAQFLELMDRKLKRTIVEPGEAVGLLCAQSIGEPSTQMTLNTFHFAGRGEMNVTLGIPRLREVLMVGSRNIKTPAMDVPVVQSIAAKEKARQLQKKFTKVYLNDVLRDLQVKEWLAIKGKSRMQRRRMFAVTFNFLPKECYQERFSVTPNQILHFIEKVYVKKMIKVIKYKIKTVAKTRLLNHGTQRFSSGETTRKSKANNDDDDDGEGNMETDMMPPTGSAKLNDDDDDESDAEDNDGDNMTEKEKRRHQDEHDYDDEIDEEDADDNYEREMPDDDVEFDDNQSEHEDLGETIIEEYERKEQHEDSKKARINAVLQAAPEVDDYRYDTKKKLWCEITLGFALQDSKLDLLALLEDHVRKVVVHEVQNISRCFLNEEKGPQGAELHLKTEGINMQVLYSYCEALQLNRLYSNSIHAMAETYGIEAASKSIIKEIQAVFAAYGIVVDYRHLSLLADYMTFEGTYKPFNRMSMETNPSPLQKMSFETTMHFLVEASIAHRMDNLTSPSAQIVVGKNVSCGTGCLDLFTPLTVS